VLTTFQLFKYGTEEEDLFGMICCLLRLVASSPFGSEEFSKVEVSISLFNDNAAQAECAHEKLSPAELADKLNTAVQDCLCPEERKKGWHAFVLVLNQIEDQHRWAQTRRPPPGYEQEHRNIMGGDSYMDDDFIRYDELDDGEEIFHMNDKIFHDGDMGFPVSCGQLGHPNRRRPFGRNRILGHIWAACQAELLTYRRQHEGDSWLSPHIDIDMILECLSSGDPSSIFFIRKGMLLEYCSCGRYKTPWGMARREHVCTTYFSNLDDWHRAEYLEAY
jgi:hypothetical protein